MARYIKLPEDMATALVQYLLTKPAGEVMGFLKAVDGLSLHNDDAPPPPPQAPVEDVT